MASFDYITKNRGSTKDLFEKIDQDENLNLNKPKVEIINEATNLNNIDHYLHTNALNKNTLRNSYVENGKNRNLVSENSIPATYSDKSKNKFLKPIRFIETLRNYLGDIFGDRDIFVGNADISLNNFFELLKSLDSKKKGISREFSDDLVIYYIFYILEKLRDITNETTQKKAEIMVRFLYIVAFYGVKVLAIDEYRQLVNMHDDLKNSFVNFFKNKKAVTDALGRKNDFIGLQCKKFVDENLCGDVKSNYSKRTNMYRLFSSMQRCIYDDGTNEETKKVLDNLGEKCSSDDTLDKRGEKLCDVISRLRDCDENNLSDRVVDKNFTDINTVKELVKHLRMSCGKTSVSLQPNSNQINNFEQINTDLIHLNE